ncbi:DUF2834 domain-containing protein [Flavobacterium columnare NBRC 100251 = ATCC 23463]|uniref:DUF2834 domain-containing protein n=2 Tax=Flavobacterium columnare TaxID=996 RepID=G8X945_FLACA|nr:DUF2834 domain-containing protein [Flavobacterium columnare]AEW85096.1 hypothetical protein FCOL_01235 [Flavobacterium columnare ATCC 49512]AMO19480.1 DUF2834 domain-containing protein [Flavobacterium columnare]ANO49128.1 hypothetical protein Pf1_00880 [Flavobacterium columnare]APT23636.1 hypothetical protein BU993_09775 [Flavobacterium columnare]AUX17421.1 hypothetical protein AQ623_03295 [Flavobacterium columnare]
MKRKHIYLLLSILGICYTWFFNIQYFQTAIDPSLLNFFRDAKCSLPAQSLEADLKVVVITFFIFYIPDAIRLKIKYWWTLIPLTILIAVAFTFPFYLFLRELKLEKEKDQL